MKVRMAIIGFAIISLGHISIAAEQPSPFEKLLRAKSLRCNFGAGVATKWGDGAAKTEKAKLTDEPIIFDSLNPKSGSVRVIANQGAEDAALLVAPGTLTIIETTDFGNVMTTTVFSTESQPGRYKAVTSRHVDIFGSLLLQQYYGTCQIWG